MKQKPKLLAFVLVVAAVIGVGVFLLSRQQRAASGPPLASLGSTGGKGVEKAPTVAAARAQVSFPKTEVAAPPPKKGKMANSYTPYANPVTVMAIPAGSLRDVGAADVDSAVQTVYWAMAAGNVEKLEKSIVLETAARAELAKLLSWMPEKSRAEYANPERMAAMFLAAMVQVESVCVSRREEISPSESVAIVMYVKPGADRMSGERQPYRQDADGNWRRVITPQLAAKWAQAITAEPVFATASRR